MNPERALTEELYASLRSAELDEARDRQSDVGGAPAQTGEPGNAWLLFGIFALIAVGVLVLLIFASGGESNSSML